MSVPTTHQIVTSADGTTIDVHVRGAGPALVICHGSVATAEEWQNLAEELAKDLTVYVMDRRGRGGSSDVLPYSLEREQEDLVAVLDLAGLGATLLGHSYGAIVSLGLALEHLPVQLVVYEPPLPLSGPVGGAVLDEYEAVVAEGDLERATIIGLRGILKATEDDIAVYRTFPNWAEKVEMAGSWVRELRETDAFGTDLARFGALAVPTLVIAGASSSPWLIDVARQFHQAVPDSVYVEIPDQDHMAHVHDPRGLAAVILDFMNGNKEVA